MKVTEHPNAAVLLERCLAEFKKTIIGQDSVIRDLLMSLVTGGHVLLEGVPGLAKTRLVKTLARLTGLSYKRIQFTPDLLPADITGTLMWEQKTGAFVVRRGPLFANIVLADEINRAPAKVQSALLEAMEEHQVTIGDESLPLPKPFIVFATQNPIEHEGTYDLPEAELDRFLIKIRVPYPSKEEEDAIVSLHLATPESDQYLDEVQPLLRDGGLEGLQRLAEQVVLDKAILSYITALVHATRPEHAHQGKRPLRDDIYRYISFGASPRASIALARCARVRALFEGRSYVLPEDVKSVAPLVLRHRLILSYEAVADGFSQEAIIERLLAFVPVP
ncbi:MAG: MoxR family ATPase [Treponemataceae bacterium]|nr:MoxR family ATPase [Treponemataceae bacterium]